MLTIRLNNALENRLIALSQKTGRPKSYYVRQAIQTFLEEKEDYLLAISRLEKNNPRILLAELKKKLGLQD
ncbi:MAG: type II toxin-antitoxin system RelB family antitoxin [Gammaproteobacteria bacterium]